jgi:selenide,water dikinase
LCPAGTQRNLQYAAPGARFAPAIGTAEQLLLADAQTAGGLLISVDESALSALIASLDDCGMQVAVPNGFIVEADLAGRIEVS